MLDTILDNSSQFNKHDQPDSGHKEINKQDQQDNGQKEINSNRGTEIESLWDNIDDITNAIITQDSSILVIIRRCQKIEAIHNEEKWRNSF